MTVAPVRLDGREAPESARRYPEFAESAAGLDAKTATKAADGGPPRQIALRSDLP